MEDVGEAIAGWGVNWLGGVAGATVGVWVGRGHRWTSWTLLGSSNRDSSWDI